MNGAPQILTLNLKTDSIEKLVEVDFDIYNGSLGSLIETNSASCRCLSNHDFPSNLHEFDIIIVDLNNVSSVKYILDENIDKKNKTGKDNYFVCKPPKNIFDPRPFVSSLLLEEIQDIAKRESLIIVFQSSKEELDYEIVDSGTGRSGYFKSCMYDFLPASPYINKDKIGKETVVSTKNPYLKDFLDKYNSEFNYKVTFEIPTIWDNSLGESVYNDDYMSFITNRNDEIVSLGYKIDKAFVFIFPQMNDYSSFLVDFLQNIAPNFTPNLFQFSTKNLWLEEKEFNLPNYQGLLKEKVILKQNWEKENVIIDNKIKQNHLLYKFLHDLLVCTDNELVSAIITYLDWLQFENVKNVDDEKNGEGVKEEDIQIENEKGLLVIEVKGIGGTSKDSDCNQVYKIKNRRAKQRNKFDVYALYIVNNQRYIPANKRTFPPFSQHQIQDAESDERGLVTTYQLFNLYFDIENGLITKEEARNSFYDYGFIEFKPSNLEFICIISEVFKKGKVSILILNRTITIKKDDLIYVEKNGKFRCAKIEEIQINDTQVSEATEGEISIKTDIEIKSNSKVFIKKQ
jgi:hypothetical protein